MALFSIMILIHTVYVHYFVEYNNFVVEKMSRGCYMAFTSMSGGVITQGEAEGYNPALSASNSHMDANYKINYLYHGHVTCISISASMIIIGSNLVHTCCAIRHIHHLNMRL